MNDLAREAFIFLRQSFFTEDLQPKPFSLPPKANTQDDPFDRYVISLLSTLPTVTCIASPGPLISPDLVLLQPMAPADDNNQGAHDEPVAIGIEIKKVERSADGKIGRTSGLDYSSTPPCGKVRVYGPDHRPVTLTSYYLFLGVDALPEGRWQVNSFVLCDGDILNDDFELYLSAVGVREKAVTLGSYGDGANRQRPMFIFANPLGSKLLDRQASLITTRADRADGSPIQLTHRFLRRKSSGEERVFSVYRHAADVPADLQTSDVRNPFPVPRRSSRTHSRGRFCIPALTATGQPSPESLRVIRGRRNLQEALARDVAAS